MIQNADDAEATEVVFIHDERSYGTEGLWADELGEYQGIKKNKIKRSVAMFKGGYKQQSKCKTIYGSNK